MLVPSVRPIDFLRRARFPDRLLGWAAVVVAVGAAAFVALGVVDGRHVGGEGVWAKPARFAASIALYLATVGWLAAPVRAGRARRIVDGVRWGVLVCMVLEITLIAGQAARGVPSHFNATTAVDAAVFSVMGAVIGLNTAFAGVLFVVYLADRRLAPAARRAGALGLGLFLVGSGVGGWMVAHGGHAVGGTGGGVLPVVGWRTAGGDLRAAHFAGLHALQAIPLVGLAVRRLVRSERGRVRAVGLFAMVYASVVAALFVRAFRELPTL